MTRFTVRALILAALLAVLVSAPATAQGDFADYLEEHWGADDLVVRTARILGGAGGGFAGYLTAAALGAAGLSVGLPVTLALVGAGIVAGVVGGGWLADKMLGAKPRNDWPIDPPRDRAATAPQQGISLLGLGR